MGGDDFQQSEKKICPIKIQEMFYETEPKNCHSCGFATTVQSLTYNDLFNLKSTKTCNILKGDKELEPKQDERYLKCNGCQKNPAKMSLKSYSIGRNKIPTQAFFEICFFYVLLRDSYQRILQHKFDSLISQLHANNTFLF